MRRCHGCFRNYTCLQTLEQTIEKHAEEMARLSLEFAKKTDYEWMLLPFPFLGTMPFPLKWLPKLREALKKGELKEEKEA